MKEILSSLNTLYKQLRSLQSPLIELLQEGVKEEEMIKKIKRLNLNLPMEIFSLYEWKNGTNLPLNKRPQETWLFPLGTFCSLENSVDRYSHFVGNDNYWNANLFLLFEDSGGEKFLIDCDEESNTHKMIIKYSLFDVDYDVLISAYDSLETLIETINYGFENGVYYYENDTAFRPLSFKIEEHIKISKKINPKSELWKLYK